MSKTKYTTILLVSFLLSNVQASDLRISNVLFFAEGPRDDRRMYAVLNLEWKNAWKNELNHDAIWVFCKFLLGDDGYRHIRLRRNGHEILQNNTAETAFNIEVPDDANGLFIVPGTGYRGDVSLKLKLAIDPAPFINFNTERAAFRAYGLEMVKVPAGSFWAGETDSVAAYQYAAFYQPDAAGHYKGLVQIQSEEQLEVGKDIGYRPRQSVYQGDAKGIIPQAFPKGFKPFYVMKYEINQGDYAAFLNSLSRAQSQLRSNFGGKKYYEYRGTIALVDDRYVATSPGRPCNFLSWDDAMAFADWCALSPMTELEFEKACRGSRKPIAAELPWGTADKFRIERGINAAGDLTQLNGKPESELSAKTLATFGASPYWVLDLAGSLWERCITVGDSTGRTFRGTHGDGVLSGYGFATNDDWPRGVSENGGFGFRGGGFYKHDHPYGDFNPHSPVSYRPYGAWSGGNRTEAYGSRLVRRD